MEADLLALLVDTAEVAGLVEDRISWAAVPQGEADPNLVLYKVTGAPGLHMRGTDGLEAALVQMNIRALSFASMIAVRNSVVGLLHGYRGIKGDTEFQQIALRDERQGSAKPETTLYYTDQLDFDVWSRSAT